MEELERDSTHFGEEDLIWFFYGEAGNSAEIDLHLNLCRSCRSDYERLKADMQVIENWSVPDREPDYGHKVWRELVRKDASIQSRKRMRWPLWLLPRYAMAAAAVASLVAMAFVAGRISQPHDTGKPAAADVVRERLLAAELSEHLERSERTLLEIANSSDAESRDITVERQSAESLLAGNRLYRQAAARQGHRALTSVLEDLERVLIDIAHSPAELSAAEAGRLRARVEDQELLFRLRVLELRLRGRQNQPVPQPNEQDSKG